jgi:type II secretory pathway component GspD/PulD (secretin)
MPVESFLGLERTHLPNRKVERLGRDRSRVDLFRTGCRSTVHLHRGVFGAWASAAALAVASLVLVAQPVAAQATRPLATLAAGADAPRALDADQPLSFAVIDQDLRAFLLEFGRMQGLSVRLSEAVQGRVRGRLPPLPPRALLQRLAAMHGFDWFLDGALLHVSASHEAASRMLPLKGVPFTRLVATLDGLALADPRWPLRHAPDANLVVVAGPPALVAQVEQALATLNDAARAEVRVARGRTGG